MLVSICILLLAKLEKAPSLIKAANIHSPQEGLSNLSHSCHRSILFMLVSICILLLAKLEKTPWLLKAANIQSPQEGLSSLSILLPGTSYLCW